VSAWIAASILDAQTERRVVRFPGAEVEIAADGRMQSSGHRNETIRRADYSLPLINGIEARAKIRAHLPKTEVLSSYDRQRDPPPRCDEGECARYMLKSDVETRFDGGHTKRSHGSIKQFSRPRYPKHARSRFVTGQGDVRSSSQIERWGWSS